MKGPGSDGATSVMERGLRWVLAAAALGAALVLVWLLWPGATPAPRDLIIISIDTLRADHLGAYGGRAKTPALDAFAAESVVFDHAYAAAPTTLASHSSMMTGRFPHHHGVPRNGFTLSQDNVLLAERFHDAGYLTAAFVSAYPLHASSGFDQGFELFDAGRYEQGGVPRHRGGARTTHAVLNWLDQTDDPRPRFVFVHYFDAHVPYAPAERFLSLYGDLPELSAWPTPGTLAHVRKVRKLLRKGAADAATQSAALAQLYAGGVSQVDARVGALLKGLRARGVLDNALVVITADHGEAFDTHYETWNHGYSTYDETARVPLMVRWPQGWQAGRSEHMVSLVDLAPTLAARFGLAPVPTDGVSFEPVLRGVRLPERGPVFVEGTKPWYDQGEWLNDGLEKAAITPRLKLIWRPLAGQWLLYDRQRDPDELNDLYDDNIDWPEVIELKAALEAYRADAAPLPTQEQADAAALEALGYANSDAAAIEGR